MLDYKIELLQRVPLFKGLPREQLGAIADCGKKTFFEAGQTIIAKGETGQTAYLIMTGKASCPKIEKSEIVIEDLWPGTLVGELGMLVEAAHIVTVTAQERLRALALERDAFHAVMEAHPSLAQHLAEKLLDHLKDLAIELRKVDSALAEAEKAA